MEIQKKIRQRSRILKRMLPAVLAAGVLTGCGSCAPGEDLSRYESMQLLADPDFLQGFTVRGQDTKDRGVFAFGQTDTDPVWILGQWNSGPCLWDDRQESAANVLTDGVIKTVTYDQKKHAVALRLNTIPYYDGRGGTTDAWPHLLMEEALPISADTKDTRKLDFYSLSADKIIVSMEIRMTDYHFVEIPGVNAAQFLSYYYVRSKTGHDFIWFGVPLFDNRGLSDLYWAMDNGSGRMIYGIPMAETYQNSVHSLLREDGTPYVSDRWISVSVDIKPRLLDMIERGLEGGYLKNVSSPDDLYLSGVNIGWEIIGSFDATVEVRNFRITSYIDPERETAGASQDA